MKIISTYLLIFLSFQTLISQSFNFQENANSNPQLLGKINKEALLQTPYSLWFQKEFDRYTPDITAISKLKTQLPPYTITAFMGTWCGDSKRQIPRLYKILEATDFSLDRLTLVAVSRDRNTYKQSPGGEEEGLNIHRVPTIIVYKNGVEINRIIESPVLTIEEDLLQILDGNYTPNHYIVSFTNDLIEEYGINKLFKKAKKHKTKFTAIGKKSSSLNTYANVLYYADQKQKAIEVLKLNAFLFPEEISVYSNLGDKLSDLGYKNEALEVYKNAQKYHPSNQKIQNAIEQLKEEL